MNIELSADERAFRDEVRAFLRDRLPEGLRRGQAMTSSVFPEPEISRPWHRILGEKGWLAPLWPVEHGGTGWTGVQRFIFEYEAARAGAPIVYPMGVRLVGPVIIAFGTQAQKDFYLPRILRDEDYWCQGFSEPGAGSDLASLATRAVGDGDHFIVNGSKIWTTQAHHANRMFTLVRTDPDAPRQRGISFLVIDLDSPGIDVRPITSIGGDHDVNQVFLTDVRVSKRNLIGEPNKGWSYAKYLLEFERGAGLVSGRLRAGLRRIDRAIALMEEQGLATRARDRAFQSRLAQVAIDIDVFEFLELKTLGGLKPGENPGPVSSILKLRASELRQDVAELGVMALGGKGARWPEVADDLHEVLVPDYLNSRAATIFGGAREVQLGIIARALFER